MWSCLFFSLESMLGTLKYDSEEYSHCTIHVRLLNCYLARYVNGLFWLVPSLCFKAIDMKMIFYSRWNKTHFHKKGFALSLVLEVRLGSGLFVIFRYCKETGSLLCRIASWDYYCGKIWRTSLRKLVVIANRRRNSVLKNKIVMLQFDKTSTWAHVRNG